MHEPHVVVVVSDSTGNTAEAVVRAALVQFSDQQIQLRMWPNVRNTDEAEKAVRLAADNGCMLVHTLVDDTLRRAVTHLCEQLQVTSVDLLGGLLDAMSDFLGAAPLATPGRPYVLDDAYFQRISAMEFSVKADDGKQSRLFSQADIVLVGVSRTSKTPVSTYLAGQGYKVANLPIVRGIEPPEVLFSLPKGRVFALTIDPETLMEIRQRRMAHLGVETTGEYTDAANVFAEVRWALDLYRSRTEWPIIDVTHLAVEETAAEILKRKSECELGG